MLLSHVDWGNVPGWLSFLVSAAALIAAIWASRPAWRQLQLTVKQDQQRGEREEREQASKVAAWLIVKEADGFESAFLRYMNSSGLLIYNLRVAPMNQVRSRKCAFVIPIVEPFEGIRTVRLKEFSWIIQEGMKGLLEDRFDIQWKNDSGKAIFRPLPSPDDYRRSIERAGVLLQFRDAQGITWLRQPDGQLGKPELDFDQEFSKTWRISRERGFESLKNTNWAAAHLKSRHWQTETIDPEDHIKDWSS